jgi:hypothetical protein
MMLLLRALNFSSIGSTAVLYAAADVRCCLAGCTRVGAVLRVLHAAAAALNLGRSSGSRAVK